MCDCLSEHFLVTYEEGTKQRKCPTMPSGWHWSLRPPACVPLCGLFTAGAQLKRLVPTSDLCKTLLKMTAAPCLCKMKISPLCHSAKMLGSNQLQVFDLPTPLFVNRMIQKLRQTLRNQITTLYSLIYKKKNGYAFNVKIFLPSHSLYLKFLLLKSAKWFKCINVNNWNQLSRQRECLFFLPCALEITADRLPDLCWSHDSSGALCLSLSICLAGRLSISFYSPLSSTFSVFLPWLLFKYFSLCFFLLLSYCTV